MFDTEKIQRMATELEKIPNDFDNVYVIPEVFTVAAVALFKRLNIRVRAVIQDNWTAKEVWGIPIIKTSEAEFNKRTVLIILTKKSMPFVQTNFNVRTTGWGIINIPAVVMAPNEVMAVYDRLIVSKFIKLYKDDGVLEKNENLSDVAERFARGLTTRLHPYYQSLKVGLFDSRQFSKTQYDFKDTAIVIQGPLVYDNNYTVETFKLYRKIYPNAPIVVSTWQGEATIDFRKACKENFIVLLENTPPEDRGAFNVNLQLKSSFQGVKYIRENTNVKYVLKTRTDQRINYFGFIAYFKNLLETFPPRGDKLHKRIIFINSNMSRSWPFFFNDFFSFGDVEDIFKLYNIPPEHGEMSYTLRHMKRNMHLNSMFWSHPIDFKLVKEPYHKLYKFNKMMSRFYCPEIYITKKFFEKYIAPIDETKLLETNWKFIADYLILVDGYAVFLDWFKYEHLRYRNNLDFETSSSFSFWLDIYKNFKIDWV